MLRCVVVPLGSPRIRATLVRPIAWYVPETENLPRQMTGCPICGDATFHRFVPRQRFTTAPGSAKWTDRVQKADTLTACPAKVGFQCHTNEVVFHEHSPGPEVPCGCMNLKQHITTSNLRVPPICTSLTPGHQTPGGTSTPVPWPATIVPPPTRRRGTSESGSSGGRSTRTIASHIGDYGRGPRPGAASDP